jgi:hypothetical protein
MAVVTRTITVRPRLQEVGLDSLPEFVVLSDTAVPLPATTSAGPPAPNTRRHRPRPRSR